MPGILLLLNKKLLKKYGRTISGKLVIVTGLSGAGKTAALRYFEDAGYYCVDNLPASLLLNLIGFFAVRDKDINKIAVAIDLRSGDLFNEIYNTLENLKRQKINYKVLFLEAAKSIIIKRFSLTRRKHPLVVGWRYFKRN